MSDKKPLHDLVGLTTDVSVLLRELCVVALFCLLFFAPVTFKSLLTRIGISKVATPFGEIDVNGAGATVSTLNRGLSDTVARLDQIQATVSDPRGKSELQDITYYLQNLQQQAQATDETIKSNLVIRQATVEQISPQSTKIPGWLFVGHVDKDKLHWSAEGARNVPATLSPVLTVGEKFSVTAPSYLREDAPSGTHFGGKVIGIVPANGQVLVTNPPDYSSAIAGGFFLWVKVQPL
jgi:hypothetical protein